MQIHDLYLPNSKSTLHAFSDRSIGGLARLFLSVFSYHKLNNTKCYPFPNITISANKNDIIGITQYRIPNNNPRESIFVFNNFDSFNF